MTTATEEIGPIGETAMGATATETETACQTAMEEIAIAIVIVSANAIGTAVVAGRTLAASALVRMTAMMTTAPEDDTKHSCRLFFMDNTPFLHAADFLVGIPDISIGFPSHPQGKRVRRMHMSR